MNETGGLFFTRGELQVIRNRAYQLMKTGADDDTPTAMAARRAWSDLMSAADHAEAMIARLELQDIKREEMALPKIGKSLRDLQIEAEQFRSSFDDDERDTETESAEESGGADAD